MASLGGEIYGITEISSFPKHFPPHDQPSNFQEFPYLELAIYKM